MRCRPGPPELQTPLHMASGSKLSGGQSEEVIRLLLAAHADPSLRTGTGAHVTHMAASGNAAGLAALIRAGVSCKVAHHLCHSRVAGTATPVSHPWGSRGWVSGDRRGCTLWGCPCFINPRRAGPEPEDGDAAGHGHEGARGATGTVPAPASC